MPMQILLFKSISSFSYGMCLFLSNNEKCKSSECFKKYSVLNIFYILEQCKTSSSEIPNLRNKNNDIGIPPDPSGCPPQWPPDIKNENESENPPSSNKTFCHKLLFNQVLHRTPTYRNPQPAKIFWKTKQAEVNITNGLYFYLINYIENIHSM